MNSFAEVFEQVKKYCIEVGNIGDVAINLWINTLIPVSLDGTKAVLQCNSEFQKGVVLNNFKSLLQEGFRNTLGFDVELEIIIESQKPAERWISRSLRRSMHNWRKALRALSMTTPLTLLL